MGFAHEMHENKLKIDAPVVLLIVKTAADFL